MKIFRLGTQYIARMDKDELETLTMQLRKFIITRGADVVTRHGANKMLEIFMDAINMHAEMSKEIGDYTTDDLINDMEWNAKRLAKTPNLN